MLRMRLVLLSALTVLGISVIGAAGASTASAGCYRVAEEGKGTYFDPLCTVTGSEVGAKEYIKAKLEKKLKNSEWCAKVEKAKSGNFNNNTCTEALAEGEFIKVKVPETYICKNVGENKGKFEENKCEKEGGKKEFEWTPVEAATAYEAENHPLTAIHLESEVAGIKISIVCEKAKGTGKLEPAGASAVTTLEFSSCKLYSITADHKAEVVAGCTIEEPIKQAEATDQDIYNVTSGGIEDSFSQKGTVFAEVKILGAGCLLKGTYKITAQGGEGKVGQICPILVPTAAAGVEVHEMICNGLGSKLELGGKKARLFIDILTKLAVSWFTE
jgi:hypothetical protein